MDIFLKKFPFKISTVSLIVFNLVLVLSSFLLTRFLPPIIPIYFGLPNGSEQLGPSIALALPPLVGLLIILIDSLIITLTDDEFLQKTLLGISIATTFLSAFAYFRIFLLVGSIF